jgi:glutamate racemase
VYFGDTAHMPYGDKSSELIKEYSTRITNYLIEEKKCKAIVIACNTASAAAYTTLRDDFRGQIPIINVIDPMVEAVISDNEMMKVGIIATKTTVQSGTYQEKFDRRKPSLKYWAQPTPLLASMIEEGFYNNTISDAILKEYLTIEEFKDIDGLILACTHYPLIKNEIQKYFDHDVKIFDSAEIVAAKLKAILEKENLLNIGSKKANEYLVSDISESFKMTTKIFFESEVGLIKTTVFS